MINKMKKFVKKFVAVFIILFVFAGLISCGDESLKIVFIVDGEVYNTSYVSENGEVSLPQNPSKEGYVFDGWYLSDTYENQFFEETEVTSDITVYAKWKTEWQEPTEYTVTFMDRDSVVSTVKFTVGATSVVAPSVPEREGYTGAWESYTLSDNNITVNAVYTPIVYNITYHNTDDANHQNSSSYTIVDNLSLVPAEKSGYYFVGWYKDAELKQKISSIPKGTVGNIELYARFERNFVELYVNGSLWKELSVADAADYSLPLPEANDGFCAFGWLNEKGEVYTDSDGKGVKALDVYNKLNYSEYKNGYTPINTAQQLRSIALNGKYALVSNIDLAGAEWTPIGSSEAYFTGELDGNGYKISNFKITGSGSTASFFFRNSGIIRNVGLEDFEIDIDRTDETGTSVAGLCASNYGYIINCYASGDISAKSGGGLFVGGLVATNDSYGVIANSYALGSVNAESGGGNICCGGLLGKNSYGAMVANSYAFVDITSVGADKNCVGGLVGENFVSQVINSYALGDVTVDSDKVEAGALLGSGWTASAVNNCYTCNDQVISANKNNTSEDVTICYAGTKTTLENFKSKEWFRENLWKAEIEIWDFSSGYPVLNYGYIKNAEVVEISDKEELKILGGQVLVLNYSIKNNIDFFSEEFETIVCFDGILDGGGFVISNLKCSGDGSFGGLLGYNAGTVRNLGMENITVDITTQTNNSFIGGIAGFNYRGTVVGCYVKGTIANNAVMYAKIGGLVGSNGGTVTNSFADVDITASAPYAYVGGMMGENSGSVSNCYAAGNVNASSLHGWVGGFAASNYSGIINSCYALGNVAHTMTSEYGSGNLGGFVATTNGAVNEGETDCYRHSNQIISFANPNRQHVNEAGNCVEEDVLKNADFQQNTLGWSPNIWSFSDGRDPALKINR